VCRDKHCKDMELLLSELLLFVRCCIQQHNYYRCYKRNCCHLERKTEKVKPLSSAGEDVHHFRYVESSNCYLISSSCCDWLLYCSNDLPPTNLQLSFL
jgi:hypothetical protein